MDGVDDDGDPGQFGGEAAYEACLRIVGVDDVVRIFLHERGQAEGGQRIFEGMERLDKVLERDDFQVLTSNQRDQFAPWRTGQICLERCFVQSLHGEIGIEA